MVSISKSINIKAPLKEIYNWVQWAPNLIGFWPNMVKTVNYEQDENGLGLHEVLYSMVGIEFKVEAQDIEKIPDQKIVAETRGSIPSVVTIAFEAIPDGTRVNLNSEYAIPVSVLRGLIESTIVRLIEKDIVSLLENLKYEMERLYGEES